MANIVYLGSKNTGTTSSQRAHALHRLGHRVTILDPKEALSSRFDRSVVGNMLHYRTGYRFVQGQVERWLDSSLKQFSTADLIWVDSGELLGPSCLWMLKTTGCPIVLYNVDDPTGTRDGRRFDSLVQALPLYDLVVVVRNETEAECRQKGAKHVLKVFRGYDEVAHQPFADASAIDPAFRSEVAFVGTWMPHEKRDDFLLTLIEHDVPVTIWGPRWHKAPYWEELQPYYKGSGLSGRDYVAAIQGAKISLGLLSKGNRDLHTQRSLEVPYAGGLLCAERTIEHSTLYREDVEAVFWSNAQECADVCHRLLKNDWLREQIRQAGMARVRALGVGNELMCQQVINTLWGNMDYENHSYRQLSA